ncbi:hypothetical protein EJ03DRAFT_349764 [Teratosphaeria nubilosa]|uniref:Uncharacterized protein n=1 Tax=Teratosphaeria nubilosa TaxID=161662 RepID=A0A6G1LEI7_9PEZI|nr:hypothetical protein EJ03DRAFT_349764 [Teratosphaeria nubilosa]
MFYNKENICLVLVANPELEIVDGQIVLKTSADTADKNVLQPSADAASTKSVNTSRSKKRAAAVQEGPASKVDRTEPASDEPAAASQGAALLSIEPQEMFDRFQAAAKKALSPLRRQALQKFLTLMKQERQHIASRQHRIDSTVDAFHTQEPRVHKREQGGLQKPSGKANARLGVVMHYPTFLKSVSEFFDEHNPCVRMLIKKGFKAENSFAFDLHWRKEQSMAQDGQCSRTNYPPAVEKYDFDFEDREASGLSIAEAICAHHVALTLGKAGRKDLSSIEYPVRKVEDLGGRIHATERFSELDQSNLAPLAAKHTD